MAGHFSKFFHSSERVVPEFLTFSGLESNKVIFKWCEKCTENVRKGVRLSLSQGVFTVKGIYLATCRFKSELNPNPMCVQMIDFEEIWIHWRTMKIKGIKIYYRKVCLHGSMNMYAYQIEQDLVGKCKCIRNVNVNAV